MYQDFAFWEDIPRFTVFEARYGNQEYDFTYTFLKLGDNSYLHLASRDDDMFNINLEYVRTWVGEVVLDYYFIQNIF